MTLEIEDEVAERAAALATREQRTLDELVSELLRGAVQQSNLPPHRRSGLPVFPVRNDAKPVTPEIVKSLLMDET